MTKRPVSAPRGQSDAPATFEMDAIPVRSLRVEDTDAVARIDAPASGRSRPDYFRKRIEASKRDGGVSLSCAAEVDGLLVGFLIASVDYGEFGVMEPVAVIDTVGVHPEYRGRHVGKALMRQLGLNLQGLRIEKVRTEVDWRRADLLAYFQASGFVPVPRLVLETNVTDIPRE